ncbi:ATP-dependent helicase HrpB [Vreelandella arcis]|uniref:ATP-dependent helicase HrpB n=1 Tax=Vreelandella arcis TaxID=416873 RepID=A0A1G9YWX8_9GAMM|nr:ATP-dependent helicase HrpB [Halomonas arcis]SDN13658.1 ATP-dependent helicase HrpB [Halomonas arcis]
MPTTLPIEEHLASLQVSLDAHNRLILVAQPGAGKTTRVPLTLLASQWAQGKKLLLLEPRRVAARLAASYMAQQLNEAVGQTVGYRMRGDSRVSAKTRLEVVTQGVLTRMLQEDPLLDGISGIIFDEFHERSIEADVGLAFALDVQQSIRDDLRLIVMSATIDVPALQKVLGQDTPVIESTGRQFPVDTFYRPLLGQETLETAASRAVQEAISMPQAQDVLVILPGVAEINRLEQALQNSSLGIDIRTLHGNMAIEAQQATLKQNSERQRVIVSTAIAESSVTVDGVNVVVDGGLERVPLFQPRTGLTRLTTRRVNRASADQRRGRAGRQSPGYCFRLWSQEQPLVAHGEPEIQQADLAKLVLELAIWGVQSPSALTWLTPPPSGAWQSAQALLQKLGIIDSSGMLTALGIQCVRWPVEPRLAVMLARSEEQGAVALACALAALLESRDRITGSLRDALIQRLRQPAHFPHWYRDAKRLASIANTVLPRNLGYEALGALLALAYPDRVGQLISPGRFKLANGKTATLARTHPLANEAYLVAANVEGVASEAAIYVAEPLELATLISLYPDTQHWVTHVRWSEAQGQLIGEEEQRHGSLVIAKRPLNELPADAITQALLNALRQRPEVVLTPEVQQLQGRMALLEDAFEGQWPDWSNSALMSTLEVWLAPYLVGISRLSQLEKMPFHTYLLGSLSWDEQVLFERLTPNALPVPSGKQAALDYLPCIEGRPPILALKLQEAFGWQETPRIADQRVAVMIHLLSPAKRPLQVTQDLRSFWLNGYADVRKEMRGRYPKHPWPEDPLSATATSTTKRHR